MLVQRGYQIKEYPEEMKENEKMAFFIQADNKNADQFMPEILQLSMSCREENKQKKHRINVILPMELINNTNSISLQHISQPITSYINMVSTAFARQIL